MAAKKKTVRADIHQEPFTDDYGSGIVAYGMVTIEGPYAVRERTKIYMFGKRTERQMKTEVLGWQAGRFQENGILKVRVKPITNETGIVKAGFARDLGLDPEAIVII
ncbi:MAG: hypothetical protein U9Q03_00805 [Patescibacteria group bacterium]|nr:hypothetical protein [Patescibacteria group bacterium]